MAEIIKQPEVEIEFSKQLLENRSGHPDVFQGKGVLEICSKFTGEHPC